MTPTQTSEQRAEPLFSQPKSPTRIPLAVDLDGTLIRTDMLLESAMRAVRDRPLDVLRMPLWLLQGKAFLKQTLASRTDLDARLLPFNRELLHWLEAQHASDRRLVLCTASDQTIARDIADHLGIFDAVIASDGVRNLAGDHKAAALDEAFGRGAYDYAGNARQDLAVWRHARRGIVVNASTRVAAQAKSTCDIERVFPAARVGLEDWRRVLRVHQWLKNALLFVPLFAAHRATDLTAWPGLILAFFAFSLCASSVYIVNDLLDLDSDRQHPHKATRPFASGAVAPWVGVVLAPLLLTLGLALASGVGGRFLPWMVFYFALTCGYSWVLKRLLIVDCLVLAMLYTLRIVAGAAAAGMSLSFWLLACSVFLFLSLAFVKRYAELEVQSINGKQKVHGRGYLTTDAPIVQNLGIASGYASALVLALYLNSERVLELYRTPEVMWGTVPLMLFWVSWMWMQAHRGNMHEDPLLFAVKDKASLATGVAFAAVLVVGTIGLPW